MASLSRTMNDIIHKQMCTLAKIAGHMVGLRMIDCTTEFREIAKLLIEETLLEVDSESYFRRGKWLRE
jgi:hypothetical protein